MLKKIVLVSIAATLVGGLSLYANARSDTPLHGYVAPDDRHCFELMPDGSMPMRNTCSSTKTIYIPASVDKPCVSGSEYWVTAQSSSSSNNVCCRTGAIDDDGSTYLSGFKCLSEFGDPQKFKLNGVSVVKEHVYFQCTVAPGAKLLGVKWWANGGC